MVGWCATWGKGMKIPLFHIVPKPAPHLCWIQDRPIDLLVPAQVRTVSEIAFPSSPLLPLDTCQKTSYIFFTFLLLQLAHLQKRT